MWRITAGGRVAWYTGDEPDHVREMVAELFPSEDDVVIEEVEDA